ncbi:MAG: tRNA uridine-5-carboxymethylaminomethyl(34) synthesis GTPase MnmE [bacterium]
MKRHGLVDTIAAISTPLGESGIGIVRLSGPQALAIADKVFLSKEDKSVQGFKTYTMHYGWVVEDKRSKMVVDEVILTVMRSPKSYTKEDVVEINCHSGVMALRRVLELVLEKGCRLSEPGEFTKRAFLNGRIDLAQAEAILDVIKAKTDYALKVGAEQLRGGLSKEINKIRTRLLQTLSVLEADIDFPDDELGAPQIKKIKDSLNNINKQLEELLRGAKTARLLREGISAVICGRTNVGKSSLLNALLRKERSIVTPIAGTTRDTVEEVMDIKGIPVKIVDTAGIIRPRDLIEKEAVRRSKRYIALADLVILLFDGSKRLSGEDSNLIKKLRNKVVLAVINKIDLKQKIQRSEIVNSFKLVIDISAKKNKNISLLEDYIADLVQEGKINMHESASISNLRHIEKIKKAQKLIAEAANSVDNNKLLYSECVCQGIKGALLALDDILGRRFSEDLLDRIFSNFCIGK